MAQTLTFSNFAKSTLTSSIDAEATQINIDGDALYPDGHFTAVIWDSSKGTPLDDTSSEIVLLIRASEGVFDAIRGGENTTPRAWQSGANIAHVVTAETMQALNDASSMTASMTEVTDNIYAINRGETNTLFSFAALEDYKTVTLPEASLCAGLSFRITNDGDGGAQYIQLYPYAGDSFAVTENTYIKIASGSTITMSVIDNKWQIISYDNARPGKMRVFTSAKPYFSMGDGVAFADTSAGGITKYLYEDDGMFGIPLTVIKYDASANHIYMSPFEGEASEITLRGQYESVTFITEADGTKRVLNRYNPPANTVVAVNDDTNLKGYERYVMVTTGDTDKNITLPSVYIYKGQCITLKKVDTGTGAIIVVGGVVYVEGASTYSISAENEYATFVSDGANWVKVG